MTERRVIASGAGGLVVSYSAAFCYQAAVGVSPRGDSREGRKDRRGRKARVLRSSSVLSVH